MIFTISGDILVKAERESGDTTTVEIPNGIRVIGEHALDGYVSATEIKIPNSVEKIDDYAFNNCLHLKKINIPDNIISIGKGAFKNCKIIEHLYIPDIKRIESDTFSGCGLLTKLSFGHNLEFIGDDAFNGCFSLKTINLPYKDNLIIEDAFYGCSSLKRLECYEGNVKYPDKLPMDTALIEPVSLQRIYMEAFNKPEGSSYANIKSKAVMELNAFNERHGYSKLISDTPSLACQQEVLFDINTGEITGLLYNNKYISFYKQFYSHGEIPFVFDYIPDNANFSWAEIKNNGQNKITGRFADTFKHSINHVLGVCDNVLPFGIEFPENIVDFIDKTENILKNKGFSFVFDKYGNLKNEKAFDKLLREDSSILNEIFEKDIWNENNYNEEYDEER